MDYFNLVYSKKKNCYCFRASSGRIKTPAGSMFTTGKPGLPDIVCCIDGKFVGIEVKTKIGRQSKIQKIAQKQIENANGEYYLIRSIQEVHKLFPC